MPDCTYCTILSPLKIPDFESLSFLPDPMLNDDGSYKAFSEVYRTATNDEHRPSVSKKPVATENDRLNKDLLVGSMYTYFVL
jgi:hypothetical protein